MHSATGQVSIFFSIQYDIQTIEGMLFLSKLCITPRVVIVNDKALILLQVKDSRTSESQCSKNTKS